MAENQVEAAVVVRSGDGDKRLNAYLQLGWQVKAVHQMTSIRSPQNIGVNEAVALVVLFWPTSDAVKIPDGEKTK